ncbi:hypothetical protein PR048_003424 [Dryococelus australis]|uniref:Uncharacterized protein n=1 Tax=Dryococelus australis TaxID=614101 RepID=A0ABQ9IN11_9NEOP|nr:hypothetical protein PR048_003424 [Dryococelus australis]
MRVIEVSMERRWNERMGGNGRWVCHVTVATSDRTSVTGYCARLGLANRTTINQFNVTFQKTRSTKLLGSSASIGRPVEPRLFRGLGWQQATLDNPLYTRDIIVFLLAAVIKTVKHSLALLLPAYHWLTVKRGVSEEMSSNHNSRREEQVFGVYSPPNEFAKYSWLYVGPILEHLKTTQSADVPQSAYALEKRIRTQFPKRRNCSLLITLNVRSAPEASYCRYRLHTGEKAHPTGAIIAREEILFDQVHPGFDSPAPAKVPAPHFSSTESSNVGRPSLQPRKFCKYPLGVRPSVVYLRGISVVPVFGNQAGLGNKALTAAAADSARHKLLYKLCGKNNLTSGVELRIQGVMERGSDTGDSNALLAFYQGEPGSIPSGLAPGFSHVGILQDDAAGRRVFSGISRFPLPGIPALLQTHPRFTLRELDDSLIPAAARYFTRAHSARQTLGKSRQQERRVAATFSLLDLNNDKLFELPARTLTDNVGYWEHTNHTTHRTSAAGLYSSCNSFPAVRIVTGCSWHRPPAPVMRWLGVTKLDTTHAQTDALDTSMAIAPPPPPNPREAQE